MGSFGLYVLFFGVPLILGLAVQGWLRSTFSRYSQVGVSSGMTGAQAAREILDKNGLHDVPVQPSKSGPLSDHYDPKRRALFLSESVMNGRSIAATAVAAHESGHAIQHAKSYVPMTVRSAIWPIAAFGSQAWFFILILGFFTSGASDYVSPLIPIALIMFAAVVLFQFVTLPVEFNASRRALVQIRELGLVTDAEATGARKTLTAAAMTYVAGALASLAQLLYFLLIFGRR